MSVVRLLKEAEDAIVGFCQGFEGPRTRPMVAPVKRRPAGFRRFDQEMDRAVTGLMNETDRCTAFDSFRLKTGLHGKLLPNSDSRGPIVSGTWRTNFITS